MDNPSPAFLMRQLINRVVALYMHDHPNYSIDDLVIAAATPAIHTKFKEMEPKQMHIVMLRMKHFVSYHSRFKNFTKEAVVEGLRKEWLPSLEDDDKALLLEDLLVIDHIDENGNIVTSPKFYDNFVQLGIKYGDTTQYGDQPYTNLKPVKKKIANVQIDEKLSEKLHDYIEWYKKWWKYMVNHESYKWNAAEYFHNTFDINAPSISANLKEALSKEINLLSGHMNFSKATLLKNAEFSPEDVRSALKMLFDEDIDLAKRATDFIEQFNMIHESNKKMGLLKPNAAPHQNPHSISVYLAFANPNCHYIYKETVWQDFKYVTELGYPPLSWFSHKLVGYNQICNHIREVLIADKELVELHDKAYPDDLSDYHMLTQDFIYAIGVHFVDFNKEPAYFNDEDAKLYNM